MARIFAIIASMVIWPIVMGAFLIVGPLFWVPILIRTLVAYAAMLLLHAVANRSLHASINALENSIVWFPRILRNLIGAFLRGFDFSRPIYESDDTITSGPKSGKGFWDDLFENLVFFAVELIPAALIWFFIYLVFKTIGIDIFAPLKGGLTYLKLAFWAGAWLGLGLLGTLLLPIVRSAIAAPFIILVALVWIPIGFIFWLPTMSVAIAKYTNRLIRAALTGRTTGDPTEVLEKGFNYYLEGFVIILSVLSPTNGPEDYSGTDEGFLADLQQILRPIGGRILSLLLYPIVWLILVIAGVLPGFQLPARQTPPVDRPPVSTSPEVPLPSEPDRSPPPPPTTATSPDESQTVYRYVLLGQVTQIDYSAQRLIVAMRRHEPVEIGRAVYLASMSSPAPVFLNGTSDPLSGSLLAFVTDVTQCQMLLRMDVPVASNMGGMEAYMKLGDGEAPRSDDEVGMCTPSSVSSGDTSSTTDHSSGTIPTQPPPQNVPRKSDVVTYPRPAPDAEQPDYPATEKRLGHEGTVVLFLCVGADGRVSKSEIRQSSGFPGLDRAALEWAQRIRWIPGTVNGRKQAMCFEQHYRFKLDPG